MDFDFRLDPSASRLKFGIEKWADLMVDFEDVFRRVVELFRIHERKHFDSEGTYTGPRHRALSTAYEEWKEDNFPGRPIMVLTGALRGAIVEGGPGSLLNIGSRLLEVGVDDEAIPYARAHAFGEPPMPQREIVRFDPDFGPRARSGTFGYAITQLFQAYIVWTRRKALGVDDPFQDTRFASRIDAMMQHATGDESELDGALDLAAQGMTG